jgi:hypothetical protein
MSENTYCKVSNEPDLLTVNTKILHEFQTVISDDVNNFNSSFLHFLKFLLVYSDKHNLISFYY